MENGELIEGGRGGEEDKTAGGEGGDRAIFETIAREKALRLGGWKPHLRKQRDALMQLPEVRHLAALPSDRGRVEVRPSPAIGNTFS